MVAQQGFVCHWLLVARQGAADPPALSGQLSNVVYLPGPGLDYPLGYLWVWGILHSQGAQAVSWIASTQ